MKLTQRFFRAQSRRKVTSTGTLNNLFNQIGFGQVKTVTWQTLISDLVFEIEFPRLFPCVVYGSHLAIIYIRISRNAVYTELEKRFWNCGRLLLLVCWESETRWNGHSGMHSYVFIFTWCTQWLVDHTHKKTRGSVLNHKNEVTAQFSFSSGLLANAYVRIYVCMKLFQTGNSIIANVFSSGNFATSVCVFFYFIFSFLSNSRIGKRSNKDFFFFSKILLYITIYNFWTENCSICHMTKKCCLMYI
jgi:hypothetical protein